MSGRVWHLARIIAHSTWFDVVIICLVGLLPLTWFRGSLIAGMDLPFPLAPTHQLMWESTSAWIPAMNLGAAGPAFRIATYCMMNSTLHWFGFSAVGVEKILFVFWFAGAGLSAYFLIRILVPNRRLAAVMGALFYMLNPYAMFVRWYELNFWPFFYALIPLMLALFILVIRTGRLRYVGFFLLASLLISPAFANLGSLAMLALVLGGYLITYLVQNRRARDRIWMAFRYTLILTVLFIGISMLWVLPTVSNVRQEAQIQQTPETAMERVEFTSRNSGFFQVLRLNGYCWSDLPLGGTQDPAVPYAKSYGNPFFGILGWIIPILGIAGLWQIRHHRGLVWPGILWVIGVFFMMGVHPPLGGLSRWMFQAIPGMSMFRHPYDKFGMIAVLGLAPLVGVGAEGLYSLTRSVIRKRSVGNVVGATVLVTVAVILLVILVWPMWTGDVIYGGGEVMPSFRIKEVPEDYEQARSWLEQQQGGFRILPLPYNRDSWVLALFDWYMGYDPSRWLLGTPVITPSSYPGGEFSEAAAYEVFNDQDRARRLCSLLNVKYILLREDANWELLRGDGLESSGGYVYAPASVMKESLSAQDWLEPAARFGNLAFYLNLDWHPLATYAAADFQPLDPTDEGDLDFQIKAELGAAEPFGDVSWSVDGEGDFSVTSMSDEEAPRVGIRQAIQLGDGPFSYSYQIRTEETAAAQLKIEWYNKKGKLIETQFLQSGVDGTTDWTPHSGGFAKPRKATRADLILLMQPQQGATMEVMDLAIEEGVIQPFGDVSWSVDGEGYFSVTSMSDEEAPWVGIRQAIQLGDGPFSYSYQIKTEETATAHLKIEWYNKKGKLIETQFLQSGVDDTTDWTPHSGDFAKPRRATRADLILLMQPQQGATMEVMDLAIEEGSIQPWVQAICQDASSGQQSGGDSSPAAGTEVLISIDDSQRLGLQESSQSSSTVPAYTVEQSSPWSTRVRIETQSPCFLVLNQAFDPGWRMYEGSPGWAQVLLGSQQLPAEHIEVNGYANGWYIDQPGEYDLTLYYWPQTLLYLGTIISALVWVFLGVWFLSRRRTARGKKRQRHLKSENKSGEEQLDTTDPDAARSDS